MRLRGANDPRRHGQKPPALLGPSTATSWPCQTRRVGPRPTKASTRQAKEPHAAGRDRHVRRPVPQATSQTLLPLTSWMMQHGEVARQAAAAHGPSRQHLTRNTSQVRVRARRTIIVMKKIPRHQSGEAMGTARGGTAPSDTRKRGPAGVPWLNVAAPPGRARRHATVLMSARDLNRQQS